MAGMRRKQRVWQEQREQILAAAAALFGRSAAADATMADVARHAGVAVGTLYKFFQSKQALHLALLEARAASILAHERTPSAVCTATIAQVAGQATGEVTTPPAPGGAGGLHRAAAEELLAEEAWSSWLDKEPERRERNAQARRAEILAAAATLFQARGVAGTSIADIAATAGVATGTVYNFFRSKEALFASLIEQATDAFFAYLHAEVDGVAPPAARIARLVAAECAFFEANRAFVRIYLTARSGFEWSAAQGLGEAFRRKHVAYLQWVAGILAEGMEAGALRRMDPAEMALALVGMLSTALIEWAIDGVPGQLAARAERITQLFLDGARSSAARQNIEDAGVAQWN